MVQVSYPGVYIREVSSGVRTITGVSTSIAAIIGMATRGPVNSPQRVLGFVDYDRIFGSDTAIGEMTDQVRQFFQNGGQQAFIVRVAHGASPTTVVVGGPAPAFPFTLTAISAGGDGRSLRTSVDYNTGAPERTFNLRIFRETVNPDGSVTISDDETHKDLSMNPTDPRFVRKVVNQNSALASIVAEIAPAPDQVGSSTATNIYASDAALATAIQTAFGGTAPATRSFNISVGTRGFRTATVSQPNGGFADLNAALTAINLAITNVFQEGAITSTATITDGTNIALRISAVANGDDVLIERAPDQDLAGPLGLGAADGGIEIGGFSDLRPIPSGFVSVLTTSGTAPLDGLLGLGALLKENLQTLVLTGIAGFTVGNIPTDDDIVFPVTTGAMWTGSSPGMSFRNIRENLAAIASAINGVQTKWRAEIHGFRLALLPRFGVSTNGASHTISATGAGWTVLGGNAGLIFDSDVTTAQPGALAFTGGSDGTAPGTEDYQDAFDQIRTNVDLFNLMILARTTSDPEGRADVWGPASSFCNERRAFLLMDASLGADSVAKVLTEVLNLRIGIVKDHAGLYWPRLTISAGNGLTRDIDPSGSIAGIMSRIDSTRGVWKAPAGLEADVRGIRGVSIPMSDPDNGLLNPQAINAIRLFPNGIVSWGARTMDGFDNSGDDDYKYVPVRRFALFIEESLFRGLKFAVFEPNDEPLWAQIRLAAGAFMNNLFRQGAFAGKTKDDAYFVKVDRETTTQNDINLGIVNVLVGFAPLKPAEFVVVTIQQKAGQVQV
jgi:phage tail sheath protein FI